MHEALGSILILKKKKKKKERKAKTVPQSMLDYYA
jgi:hypothetical protein